MDDGEVIFELLFPLVLPEGDGDHRYGYFVFEQPGQLDYREEGGPTDRQDLLRGNTICEKTLRGKALKYRKLSRAISIWGTDDELIMGKSYRVSQDSSDAEGHGFELSPN